MFTLCSINIIHYYFNLNQIIMIHPIKNLIQTSMKMCIIKKYAFTIVYALVLFSCGSSEMNMGPYFTTEPNDITVFVGDTNSNNCLTTTASDYEGNQIYYQWYILISSVTNESKIIEGATSPVYIPDKSKAGLTKYFVVICDNKGGVESASRAAMVTVLDQ